MMIDTFNDGMSICIRKDNEQNGTYINLATMHPECAGCECCDPYAACECGPFKEKPSYVLSIQYDNPNLPKDSHEFDSFEDAFYWFIRYVKEFTEMEAIIC